MGDLTDYTRFPQAKCVHGARERRPSLTFQNSHRIIHKIIKYILVIGSEYLVIQ